ncbi:hypothetical protein Tco_1228941 [Tanacetum coccineum]
MCSSVVGSVSGGGGGGGGDVGVGIGGGVGVGIGGGVGVGIGGGVGVGIGGGVGVGIGGGVGVGIGGGVGVGIGGGVGGLAVKALPESDELEEEVYYLSKTLYFRQGLRNKPYLGLCCHNTLIVPCDDRMEILGFDFARRKL